MRRTLVFPLVLFSLLFISFSVCAADKQKTVPATPSPKGQLSQINSIAKTAAASGVHACIDSIDKVGNFITANTRNRGYVFLPSDNADSHMTSASIEVELSNKSVAYASMTTAPLKNNDCDTVYETVTYWEGPCADVAVKVFPDAKLAGALQQQIMVLQGGQYLRIYLMPAGTQGCVAIKKEVIF